MCLARLHGLRELLGGDVHPVTVGAVIRDQLERNDSNSVGSDDLVGEIACAVGHHADRPTHQQMPVTRGSFENRTLSP